MRTTWTRIWLGCHVSVYWYHLLATIGSHADSKFGCDSRAEGGVVDVDVHDEHDEEGGDVLWEYVDFRGQSGNVTYHARSDERHQCVLSIRCSKLEEDVE